MGPLMMVWGALCLVYGFEPAQFGAQEQAFVLVGTGLTIVGALVYIAEENQ